jgi:hypothetical protein
MSKRTIAQRVDAARTTAQVFGVLAGIGGFTHGVGEVLQGDTPVGLFLNSWTTGPIASNMGGEPGLTILPTAISAGIATLLCSTAVTAWSALGMRRPDGGRVLMLLSTGMLLAGGGVGPPVIGLLAGAIGRRTLGRNPGWVARLSDPWHRRLAATWPIAFGATAANAVFLVLGSLVLVYGFDFNHPDVFERSFYATLVGLLLLAATAPPFDAQAPSPAPEPDTEQAPQLVGA